jgi:TRAP-type mannitol/chloroaromatic compound transport system permease small subunit
MMENKIQVPYIVYESMATRQERTIKRLWVIIIILIAALIATNAGWIYYESQFQIEETSIKAEQDGDINIVGGGDVNYGAEGIYQDPDTNP